MKQLLFLALGLVSNLTIAQNPSAEHTSPTGSVVSTPSVNTTTLSVASQSVQSDSTAMIRVGCTYLGTPYVANTLEGEGEEQLVIRKKEVDCIIFVEYTLAEALGGSFEENLKRIRYRDGIINGYPSRLHYTCDWIENGVRNGFLTDVAAQNQTPTMKLSLSFMSSHAQRYKKLAHSPENVAEMVKHEQRLSGKTVHWIPEEQLPDSGFPWIHDGDIITLTTNVKGLDVSHVGIAIYQKGQLHLMHASSTLKKVVISDEPLRQMLLNSKSWTGIRVVRMKTAQ